MKCEIFSNEKINEIEKHLQDSLIAINAMRAAQNKGSLPMVMKEVGELLQSLHNMQKSLNQAMTVKQRD